MSEINHPKGKPLPRTFYLQPTVEVARQLLGQMLVRRIGGHWIGGRIVEAEAYLHDDPACHAFKGMRPRNATMFGPPGHAYVYRSYGVHHCLNAVTAPHGVGEAILIRAIEPLWGLDFMQQQRGEVPDCALCRGPGNLCRALGIDTTMDGTDLIRGEIQIWQDDPVPESNILHTPRIGLTLARDKPLRFVLRGHPCVSRNRGSRTFLP